MLWRGQRQSDNIEDLRDVGGGAPGGTGGGLPISGGGLSLGTIAIIVLGAWLLGFNPLQVLPLLLGASGGGTPVQTEQPQSAPGSAQTGAQPDGTVTQSDDREQFVATILADLEGAWTKILAGVGVRYVDPTLVLFTGKTSSGCGFASEASGPFYCPADQKVYLDLAFFDDLRTQFDAPGEFAEAYVVAHEVGHHVQNLLGTLPKVNAEQARVDQEAANALSIRIELQADCYAGIWANQSQKIGIIQDGDIESALNAAAEVGDDAIQRRTQGYVVPETFNHGTSEQRARWFKAGYQGGTLDSCNTFSAAQL